MADELQWIRVNGGFGNTECGRYQMSIAKLEKGERCTVFHVTGDPMNPYNCIGWAPNTKEARQICEVHNNENRQQGTA